MNRSLTLGLSALLGLLHLGPAHAADAHYEAYAAGLAVAVVDADFDVRPDGYRVRLGYRTVGALGLLFSSALTSEVLGRFEGGRAIPERFQAIGRLRGDPRVTDIQYVGGQPQVRRLVPPNEAEREAVAPERQRDTVDSLSAMAALVRMVNETGRCDGQATLFDGRRLSTLQVRTAGVQDLEATGRSSFAGATLRCEFIGRQLGGFMLDGDRAALAKPQEGTAWFGATVPGAPKIPVRIAVRTRWFGEVTMYVASRGDRARE